MKPSRTPITDAAEFNAVGYAKTQVVPSRVARKIERENARLRKIIDDLQMLTAEASMMRVARERMNG